MQEDLTRALDHLERSKIQLAEATAGLAPAGWVFKHCAAGWSIAEIVEHLAATEEFILEHIAKNVDSAPEPVMATTRNFQESGARAIAEIYDRSKRRSAPDRLLPTNRFGTPEEARARFFAARSAMEELLMSCPRLGALIPRPSGGSRDVYGWIVFAAAHTERHLAQIDEVKSSPASRRAPLFSETTRGD